MQQISLHMKNKLCETKTNKHNTQVNSKTVFIAKICLTIPCIIATILSLLKKKILYIYIYMKKRKKQKVISFSDCNREETRLKLEKFTTFCCKIKKHI